MAIVIQSQDGDLAISTIIQNGTENIIESGVQPDVTTLNVNSEIPVEIITNSSEVSTFESSSGMGIIDIETAKIILKAYFDTIYVQL